MTEKMTDNQARPEGTPPNGRQNGQGLDLGAIVSGLLAAGNRRRLVLRHQGETVLRLPLTIAAVAAFLLLWQSPLLFFGAVALVFFLHLHVSFEYRPPQYDRPVEYRD